jgi:hypothetical protein
MTKTRSLALISSTSISRNLLRLDINFVDFTTIRNEIAFEIAMKLPSIVNEI